MDLIQATVMSTVVSFILLVMAAVQPRDQTRIKHNPVSPMDKWVYSDEKWRRTFRFQRSDLARLATALRIPAIFRVDKGPTATGVDALGYLLYRYGKCHDDLDAEEAFHRDERTIGKLVTGLEDFLYTHFSHSINNFHPVLITRDTLSEYASAIEEKDCPVHNVWGFIDGCRWQICRPGGLAILQRPFYSGYISGHCVAYQVISGPDGMIWHLFGPIPGSMNDLGVLALSNVLETMTDTPGVFTDEDGEPFVVYADAMYHSSRHLFAPAKGRNVPHAFLRFNKIMSALRVSIEWTIGKVYSLFKYLHYWDRHKVFHAAIAKRFLVGVLLANCHTCLYGSEAASYFGCEPPELEEYLGPMFRERPHEVDV